MDNEEHHQPDNLNDFDGVRTDDHKSDHGRVDQNHAIIILAWLFSKRPHYMQGNKDQHNIHHHNPI